MRFMRVYKNKPFAKLDSVEDSKPKNGELVMFELSAFHTNPVDQ